MYHLSARRRSGTSTRERPVKLLQARKQGPDPSMHPSHISSALPSRPRNKRFISGTSGRPAAPGGGSDLPPPSRSTTKKPPPTVPFSFHHCARAPHPSTSDLLIRKSSFNPSRQTQVHDASPMFLHHACDAVPFPRVGLGEAAVATRAAFEDREGAREQETREDGGGGVGALLLTRACLVFSERGVRKFKTSLSAVGGEARNGKTGSRSLRPRAHRCKSWRT